MKVLLVNGSPHKNGCTWNALSLKEQHLIVHQVEKLLARVEEVKERLNWGPAIMHQVRQSVLATACSGRLIEENVYDIEWKNVEFNSVVIGQKEGIKTGPFGSM